MSSLSHTNCLVTQKYVRHRYPARSCTAVSVVSTLRCRKPSLLQLEVDVSKGDIVGTLAIMQRHDGEMTQRCVDNYALRRIAPAACLQK